MTVNARTPDSRKSNSMSSLPLVSVVCLCHNQGRFVRAAIESVLTQTYQNVELIVVDDGSIDDSKQVIMNTIKDHSVHYIDLHESRGNCAAFNIGLKQSKGAFIIDLAGDDMLLPKRIEEGVNDFLNAGDQVGVHFSDALISNEDGQILHTFYPRDHDGNLLAQIPDGDVFELLVRKYFISPPTMMTRREVFEELGGYDESLAYEDFDFWIRSSRNYHYLFNKAPLVKKRNVSGSHGKKQFDWRNSHQKTTLKVCSKIMGLARSRSDYQALIARCFYEIKQCLLAGNFNLMLAYFSLIREARAHRRLSSPDKIDK